MTKKDFELIANVLKAHYGIAHVEQAQRMQASITEVFADTLASKNPRFNREKFLQACGVYPSASTIPDSEHSREYLQAEKDTFMRDVDSI